MAFMEGSDQAHRVCWIVFRCTDLDVREVVNAFVVDNHGGSPRRP